MIFPVVILAGGFATRLYPLSLETPKSLVKVNGRAFLSWQLELLASSGITSVILCLGHRAQDVIDFVGNGDRFGLSIQFSVEKKPLGTGGALKKAEPLVEDVFGVLYGDSYLPIEYRKIFESYVENNKLCLMTVFRNNNRFEKSNVYVDTEGKALYSKRNFSKKMQHVDFGFSVISRRALENVATDGFCDLSDIFERLSQANQLGIYEVQARFYEVGSFEGIVDLEHYLKRESK